LYNIIGLGKAGCNIADKFVKYPQYKIYKLDSENLKAPNYFKLPKCKTIEEYENETPNLNKFLKGVKGNALFIVGGSGKIAGASLRILQQIRHCSLTILYIRPDIELLDNLSKKQERVVYYVLQESARSSLFERMYIVGNSTMANIIGNLPVAEYFDQLNDLLASTMHMINVFENSLSVVDTHSEIVLNVARISTIGIYDQNNNEEKWFYPMEFPREKTFFYAFNKERLQEDGQLHNRIIEQIKKIVTKHTKVSYGIYETEYEQDYVYCKSHCSKIQD